MKLTSKTTLGTLCPAPAVRAAMADLARDLSWVVGAASEPQWTDRTDIVAIHDPRLGLPEQYRVEIGTDHVRILGADVLGVIYGLYHFSRQALGVDPFWFWRDTRPLRHPAIEIPPTVWTSPPSTFRYRGWFVNDEDLLTEWMPPSGPRFIRYPYYPSVMNLELADRIFETLLRCRGNLIIPASFCDILNPPEARLIERACARGLYVSQHHIEPLGVSHFGFENYWAARGQEKKFSYGGDPQAVREVWRAHAQRWSEIAGDRVVWQLGLRGRGDAPIWKHDPSIAPQHAGEFISRAMAEQWAIVRSVDPRPMPPATTTLWMEGAALMKAGALRIPEDVAIIFSDDGRTQCMQEDFRDTPRDRRRQYGAYYHIAYWIEGPHLVQGTDPAKMKHVLDDIVERGDTYYVIFNVSNIREHVLGIEAAMEIVNAPDPRAWQVDDFMTRWAPTPIRRLYEDFIGAWVRVGEQIWQDGTCYAMARDLLQMIGLGRPPSARLCRLVNEQSLADARRAVERLAQIASAWEQMKPPMDRREFYEANLSVQVRMLRGFYLLVLELHAALTDRTRLAAALDALDSILVARKKAEQGAWAGWYRGDRKENLQSLRDELAALLRTSV